MADVRAECGGVHRRYLDLCAGDRAFDGTAGDSAGDRGDGDGAAGAAGRGSGGVGDHARLPLLLAGRAPLARRDRRGADGRYLSARAGVWRSGGGDRRTALLSLWRSDRALYCRSGRGGAVGVGSGAAGRGAELVWLLGYQPAVLLSDGRRGYALWDRLAGDVCVDRLRVRGRLRGSFRAGLKIGADWGRISTGGTACQRI